MAWSYRCEADGMEISAETQEQLADKLMQHANQEHNMRMTRDQAEQIVRQEAMPRAA